MEKIQSLSTPFTILEKKLNPVFEGKFWKIKLIVLALLVSAGSLLLFNFIFVDMGFRNLYQEMRHPGTVGGLFWDDVIEQGEDPFTPKNYEPGTHEANQTFRLTVPLIARVLHLNVTTLYLLQVLVGFVFLWVVVSVVYPVLESRMLTFYFLTGFTAIYAGANFYLNTLGHLDVFPFCFLALALYLRKPVWVLLFSQLAFWCDERAIINASFVGLWFLLPFINTLARENRLKWQLVPPAVYTLIVSGVLYVVVRKWMELSLGLSIGHDNSLSVKSVLWSLSIFGDKATRGLEAMWLLIIAALVVLMQSRRWLLFTLYAGALAINLVIMLMVADGTRALSFGFVAFFLALKVLHEQLPVRELKYLLIVSALISLMLPISFP